MPDESNVQTVSGGRCQDGPWKVLLDETRRAWPLGRWQGVGVVIGCSGGADSVGLLTLLAELRHDVAAGPAGFLVAAHFNHGLRGAESDRDQQFVQELAERLGVQYACRDGDGAAADEAGMRQQRIDFLTETAHRTGARYIALAHSADDNIETVLHHLLRGTGPSGLTGIRSFRPIGTDLVLARPLLQVRREQIRDGLRANKQSWCEDSSNQNADFRRNWIRHKVIPLLQEQFPKAGDAILRAIDGQCQWNEVVQRSAEHWVAKHQVRQVPLTLDCDGETPSIHEAILIAACQRLWDQSAWPRQKMSQRHWKRLATAIKAGEPVRFSLPGGIHVVLEAKQLILDR
ncbi:MAG: tRNA lysidine(34) synthetase TilS [Planctomycetota bacterium]|nr:tRNA lysidine(34) synthetase TilS [Planctomycetota bacterium]